MKIIAICVLFLWAVSACAQQLTVKIVDRREHDTAYSYQVPQHSTSDSTGTAHCSGDTDTINCSGSSTTSTTTTPPRSISYSVTGTTLALLVPDGRTVVVNCVSKYKLKMDYINRRSCKSPLVDQVDVDFSGKSAKLYWPVSLNGKKFDSETYTVLGIIPAPAAPTPPTHP
jgi:hypothetical protein